MGGTRLVAVLVAGVAIGVAASATLGAQQASDKEQRVAGRTEVVANQTGTATTDTKFVEISPVRAFDSRIPAYAASGAFAPNTSRVISIKNGHNAAGGVTLSNAVPAGATAVAYNVTVTGPTGPNFLAVTPGNATSFTTSAINFNGTADVANAGIVAIAANRTVKVWNGNQGGSTHVIIDITGYYVKPLYAVVAADGTLTDGSRVVSVTPFPPGEYDVRFDRPVEKCSWIATIGEDFAEPAGLIDVAMFGSTDTITVFTQDPDGAPPDLSDRAFHLTVTC